MAGSDLPTEDVLRALGRRDQRPPCKVGKVLAELSPAESTWLEPKLIGEDEELRRGAKIWLRNEKHLEPPSPAAMSSHRDGNCTCTSDV